MRSKRFNQRLKQTLKQHFDTYKRDQYNLIPDSTDADKMFYKNQLAKDLNISEVKKE